MCFCYAGRAGAALMIVRSWIVPAAVLGLMLGLRLGAPTQAQLAHTRTRMRTVEPSPHAANV